MSDSLHALYGHDSQLYFHAPTYSQGDVFYRPEGSSGELVVIDREVLKVAEVYQCSAPGWSRGLPFSDGINIGHISPDREVSSFSVSPFGGVR